MCAHPFIPFLSLKCGKGQMPPCLLGIFNKFVKNYDNIKMPHWKKRYVEVQHLHSSLVFLHNTNK